MSELSYGRGTPARWGCPTCVAQFGEVMQGHELCSEAYLALPGLPSSHRMWLWLGSRL